MTLVKSIHGTWVQIHKTNSLILDHPVFINPTVLNSTKCKLWAQLKSLVSTTKQTLSHKRCLLKWPQEQKLEEKLKREKLGFWPRVKLSSIMMLPLMRLHTLLIMRQLSLLLKPLLRYLIQANSQRLKHRHLQLHKRDTTITFQF